MRSDTAPPLVLPASPVLPLPPAIRPVAERPPLPLLTPAQWSVQVNRHLIDCRRQRSSLALVLVSVDPIRLIDGRAAAGAVANPSVCQEVLDNVAQRLRGRVRSTDRVVSLGEHRFGVVLLGAGARQAAVIDARLASALAGSHRADEQLLAAESRSAVVAFPEDASGTDTLMHSLFSRLPPR